MINKIILFAFLSAQVSIAQKITYIGVVEDKESKLPIFGAAITFNGRLICFSDEEGTFTFELDASFSDKKIDISHLSFNPKNVLLSSFAKKTKVIQLTRKHIELEEVVITGSNKELSQKDIFKKAALQFKTSYRYDPYWSGINYKQAIYNNGVPEGYLECDGHIFMTGKSKKTIFHESSSPIIIPNEMRRLSESPEISKLDFIGKNQRRNPFISIGSNIMVTHWDNYLAFEAYHPLTTKGKRYFDFNIEETEHLDDGQRYYIISFNQKKTIPNAGWGITNMQGKLWVNKDSFVLHKTNVEFKNGWLKNYIKYNINYSLIDDIVFPKTISFVTYKFTYYNNKNHNIVKKGLVKFIGINTTVRSNYSLTYGGRTSTVFYDVHEKYTPEYWKNRQLQNSIFKKDVMSIVGDKTWDSAFKEGAQQREYKKNSMAAKGFKLFKENRNEILKIMKKDLNLH